MDARKSLKSTLGIEARTVAGDIALTLTQAELLDQKSNDSWLADNVWHPFANGTGLLQIYDTVAGKPQELYKVPQARTFSSNWCAQALSSAAGAIIPYVIAGKLSGMGMRAASESLGLQGNIARVLASENIAQIAGAGLYTFAQKPAEGQTRLAAATGAMAGFAVFSGGNLLLGKTIPPITNPFGQALARGTSRFAIGAIGGLASYEANNFVASLQGVHHEKTWDERWHAMAHGGFVNVALPVVQENTGKVVNAIYFQTKMATPADRDFERGTTLVEDAGTKSIAAATREYEKWMRDQIKTVPEDLAQKHIDMAADPFKFMRATYYRWAQKFPELNADLMKAPRVKSVGDLHIDNFGTWTDKRGRTIWGVNDFDEAYPLPYTNDLVRLLTSANILRKQEHLKISLPQAVDAVLTGYRQGLKEGGDPFVLGEKNQTLTRIARSQMPEPRKYWKHLQDQLTELPESKIPIEAITAMKSIMPDALADLRVGQRQAGQGSLGRQRFVAITESPEKFAAEAKAKLPSANNFAEGKLGGSSYYKEVLENAVRVLDPYVKVEDNWVVRSLSPTRSKIELAEISKLKDETHLLWAMGYETANIHLGTKNAGSLILRDLASRGDNGWLLDAVKTMTKNIMEEQQIWKEKPN